MPIKMSEVRAKFPMYADVPDDQLLIALRKKYYSDIPSAQFYSMIDRDTERDRMQQEHLKELGFTGQFVAGAGQQTQKAWNTIKRLNPFSDYSQEDAQREAEQNAYADKALSSTKGGTAGAITADVAMTALPALRVARGVTGVVKAAPVLGRTLGVAAPYVGAAAGGAGAGALLSPEDWGSGATTGAAFGAAGELGGRVLSAAYRGGKALAEPLWEAGRERVLKRTLERGASDLPAVQRALANPQAAQLVKGTSPTLAETTMDPGLIQLQRGAQAASPEVATALHESNLKRVGAYREALDDMAGTSGARAQADAARRKVGGTMYDEAFSVPVDMANVPPEVAQRAAALIQRPSIKRAMPRAIEDAAEQGLPFDGTTSIRGLHQIKTALDDEIGELALAGKSTRSLEGTRDELLTLLDDLSGGKYDAARAAYAAASKPVNQMQIAEQLRGKAFPPISEYSDAITRTNPNQYARALEDTMATTRRATGMKNLAIEDVLTPQQMGTVQGIGKDMARNTAVQEVARIPGSPTAQLMAAQNVLRGFLGPMGLPESVLDHQIGKIASGVMGIPYRWTEPQLQQMLAKALTDPREASRLLAAKDPKTVLEILQPYASQMAVQAGIAQKQQ